MCRISVREGYCHSLLLSLFLSLSLFVVGLIGFCVCKLEQGQSLSLFVTRSIRFAFLALLSSFDLCRHVHIFLCFTTRRLLSITRFELTDSNLSPQILQIGGRWRVAQDVRRFGRSLFASTFVRRSRSGLGVPGISRRQLDAGQRRIRQADSGTLLHRSSYSSFFFFFLLYSFPSSHTHTHTLFLCRCRQTSFTIDSQLINLIRHFLNQFTFFSFFLIRSVSFLKCFNNRPSPATMHLSVLQTCRKFTFPH